jgi:anti-anti-sigma regulatory factor
MEYARYDKEKALLIIYLEGRFDVPKAEKWLEDIESALCHAKEGFKIITDLSRVDNISEAAIEHIEHAMELCGRCGASVIARVIPEPAKDVGFNIMSIFHYSKTTRIYTCATLEEAMKKLFR